MQHRVMPWRKIALLGVLALLVALPLNIAVAWLAAWTSPLERQPGARALKGNELLLWQNHLPQGLSADPLYIHDAGGLGIECRFFYGDRTGGQATQVEFADNGGLITFSYRNHTEHDFAYLLHVRAGWPRPALHGWWWEPARPFEAQDSEGLMRQGPGERTVIQRGIVVSRQQQGNQMYRILPWQPVWRDLLLNVLFYAGLIWLLMAAPIMMRRGWRYMRGRCAPCGYDLRGEHIKGCPECGWRRDTVDGT